MAEERGFKEVANSKQGPLGGDDPAIVGKSTLDL